MASWRFKESDLILDRNQPLGEGGFGTVYQANLKGKDQPVAAKVLKAVNVNIDQNVEVNLLQQMCFFNILMFFGAVVTKDKRVILVTELAEKGSLRDYLSKDSKRLPDGRFFRWALHGTRAVQYLQRVKVVHRDIKSPNFLIDGEDVLKLCDFGLAKILERTEDVTTDRGSTRWMAPECFKDYRLSPKSDIFALGVVIWELITRELPYSDLMVEQAVMWAVGNDNRRPEIPADVSPGMRDLIERCWDADRTKRPHIDEVVHVLETEWLKRNGSLRREKQETVPYNGEEATLNMELYTAVLAGDKDYCQELVYNGAIIDSTGKFGTTPLHAAVVSQQIEMCQFLIEAGQNLEMIEATDNDNWTPLSTAARTGQHKICELLLTVGAKVDPITEEHMSPLYLASQYGHTQTCELLLDARANIEMKFKGEFTPLRIASSYGHDQTCRVLLQRGADPLAADKLGNTSLHIACSQGYDDVAHVLLYNSAGRKSDVNSRAKLGKTPLMNAAERGSMLICHYLLGLNADLKAQTEDTGAEAIHFAAENGHTDVCELLIDNGADITASGKANWRNTPLHLAALNGHEMTCIHLIIARNAQVNLRNYKNATPLHLAITNDHAEVCQVLLQNGADQKMDLEEGRSTLCQAARAGHGKICKILVEHCVGDAEETSADRESAFHAAAYRGHENVCEVLLEAGVDVNSADDEGWTALHESALCGYKEICKVLLKANAEVNVATSNDGKTPLHVAAENGHESLCLMLVQAGADVHATDHDQSTPLHIAAENGHKKTCQILVESGGKARSKNESEKTAIDLAEEKGYDDVSEFLQEAQPTKIDQAAAGAADFLHQFADLQTQPDIDQYASASAGFIRQVGGLAVQGLAEALQDLAKDS